MSPEFGHIVHSLLLNFWKSLISFFISSLTQWWFSWLFFNFHVFVGFLQLVLLLNSHFKPSWSHKIHGVIPSFCNCWGLLYVFNFETVSWGAEKKVYCFVFGWMFCRFLLSPFESWHLFSLLSFCLGVLSVVGAAGCILPPSSCHWLALPEITTHKLYSFKHYSSRLILTY